jgi:hypothetical protein
MTLRNLNPEPRRLPMGLSVWPVVHDHAEMNEFAGQEFGIRKILQAVEDVLVDSGHYDFLVATRNGSFHWMRAPDRQARR